MTIWTSLHATPRVCCKIRLDTVRRGPSSAISSSLSNSKTLKSALSNFRLQMTVRKKPAWDTTAMTFSGLAVSQRFATIPRLIKVACVQAFLRRKHWIHVWPVELGPLRWEFSGSSTDVAHLNTGFLPFCQSDSRHPSLYQPPQSLVCCLQCALHGWNYYEVDFLGKWEGSLQELGNSLVLGSISVVSQRWIVDCVVLCKQLVYFLIHKVVLETYLRNLNRSSAKYSQSIAYFTYYARLQPA